MTRIWQVGRVVLGVALIALIVFGPLPRRDGGTPIRVTSSTPADALAQAFADDGAAAAGYADAVAPATDLAALLAGAAARGARVTVSVPGALPSLTVTPPPDAIAMRRSALDVVVRGVPDTDMSLTIDRPSGRVDSLTVSLDSGGRGSVAVAVEPAAGGAATWTVHAGGASASAHAWVRPAQPVRVLLLTGTPQWESRYLARALEAAGAEVSVHQELGRDQIVSTAAAARPRNLADLRAWDVVALVDPPADTPDGLLLEWARSGGGLLLVGTGSSGDETAAWGPAAPAREVSASTMSWGGPVEIVPLPGADLGTRAAPLSATYRGMEVAATTDGAARNGAPEVVAAVDWIGRGRIFTSAFETWPWAMEAGLTTEHAAYWESVVEWLAGGLTRDFTVRGPVGTAGVAWTGRVEGAYPQRLPVVRPERDEGDDGIDFVRLSPVGATARVRFLPLSVGVHGLGAMSGVPVLPASAPTTWTSAALTIGGEGGTVRARDAGASANGGTPLRDPATRLWLIYLLLTGIAVAGWASRRVAGLA